MSTILIGYEKAVETDRIDVKGQIDNFRIILNGQMYGTYPSKNERTLAVKALKATLIQEHMNRYACPKSHVMVTSMLSDCHD